jgi:heat shock protein HslJ
MKRALCLVVLASMLAGLALAGCGTGGGSGGRLEGTRWMLKSYSVNGALKNIPTGSAVDALFESGKVSGNSGVNTYSGSYKLSGNKLTVGNIASTLMAGPRDLMALEQDYLSNLEKTQSYTAGSDDLTLYDPKGHKLLVYSKGRAAELTGLTWEVISYYNGRDAVTGVINGTTITAVFGTDGAVSGSTGVNEYSAAYKTDADKITVGPPAMKSSNVDGNPDITRQEADYLAALPLATRYEIRGDTLDLFRSGGTLAVTYQRAR